jgi:hypothetical protein
MLLGKKITRKRNRKANQQVVCKSVDIEMAMWVINSNWQLVDVFDSFRGQIKSDQDDWYGVGKLFPRAKKRVLKLFKSSFVWGSYESLKLSTSI